jgi:hypothetical protein
LHLCRILWRSFKPFFWYLYRDQIPAGVNFIKPYTKHSWTSLNLKYV